MNTATKVKNLDFSDLYLGHPGMEDRFSDVPGVAANPLPAGPALRKDLDQLVAVCRQARVLAPMAATFKVDYDGVAYRVSIMHALAGDMFVLRRIADKVLPLAELGIPQAYIPHLLGKELTGLFLVSGPAKSGKTRTACAMVAERLALHGGVAVTGENPIELPLEGSYGNGICFQTALPADQSQFAGAFRNLLRAGAGTIFIDEIRDPHTAAEVLHASVNGHLIVTTVLADGVIQAITKLYSLAHHELAHGSAQALLADGLIGVLHQQVSNGSKRSLEAEFLYFKDAPVTKAVLRSGRYELLASDIRQQKASMISENAAAQRLAMA